MKKWFLSLFTLPFFFPEPAFAHAFGKLYNLPIPFWMYVYGSTAALIVSFLVIGALLNKTGKEFSYPTRRIAAFTTDGWFTKTARIISFFLFLLTLATGIFGINNSYSNFNMTFFWIIFVLGLTYITAFLGNIYKLLNPWKILIEWLLLNGNGLMRYPAKLGYFPALIFYFLFIWFELIGQTTPFTLSLILFHYTIINILGTILFGRDSWFRYCEFFSVFFRIIGKMAPIEERKGALYIRPPFMGLLKEKATHLSLLLFILFMLSSTAFDGFRETLPWVKLYWGYIDDMIRPVLGDWSYQVFQTIGLLSSPFVFLAIYTILIALTKVATRSKLSLKELSLQFAFSLIPIAFVYNVAHYYMLLFTEGPNIFRLVSDPFGFGWNLFNTSNYYAFFLPGANFVWHSQVALILGGHIVGVYLAHVIALSIFPSHKKALVSQLPMLILMVIYTMIGLWILSQPLA